MTLHGPSGNSSGTISQRVIPNCFCGLAERSSGFAH
jgi:hypothetical protein